MNVIEINNLSFHFSQNGSETPFQLFVQQLKIEEGEHVSILGPNGCGKSTLLKIISNLLRANKGEIKIYSKTLQQYSLNELSRLMAYVPQNNYSVFPFSVFEVVMMGRTPYLNMMGFEKKDDRDIVFDAMKVMEVDHLAKKGIGELSGGEAQRVIIARALAQKAKIILLDEPNSHMDLEHQIMIYEMLKKINDEEKITVLNVSHDLNFVGIYSERVIILQSGNILYDGDKANVLTKERIREVFNVDATIYQGTSKSINVLVNPIEN